MTYVIALPCVDVKDRACIDECPVDCIYEGDRSLYIHPDECVDCGACEPVCPVEAIYYEDDLPDEWQDYYKANMEFFDEIEEREFSDEFEEPESEWESEDSETGPPFVHPQLGIGASAGLRSPSLIYGYRHSSAPPSSVPFG